MTVKLPPLVPSKGLLGSAKEYLNDPLDFLDKHQKEYGDIYRFRLGNRKLFVISHPAYVEHVLQKNHRNYKKSLAYQKLSLLLGNGLFTSEGDFWMKQRRLAAPSFHHQQINDYFHIIGDECRHFEQSIQDGQQIPFSSEMTRLTLRMISRTLLGHDIDKEFEVVKSHLPPALSFLINRVFKPFPTPLFLPTSSNRQFKNSVKQLDNIIFNLIASQKQCFEENSGLLATLIAARDGFGNPMSDQQLRDEVITYFLAGHETTAISVIWTMYALLSDTQIMQRLGEALQTVNLDSYESIASCVYLDWVVKESMRLNPPVWVMSREAKAHDEIGGYSIKPGDSLVFSQSIIHKKKNLWGEDADLFRPERFQQMSTDKYAYFPFGGGPRLCVGKSLAEMEIKTILARLVKKFTLSLEDKQHPGYEYSLTLRPKQEVFINLSSILK